MKYLLSLIVLISSNAYSIDCTIHKVYCKIKELRPEMKEEEIKLLSDSLYKNAKKYGGDAVLAVAIAMQETGLKKKNKKQKSIIFTTSCEKEKCKRSWHVIEGATDVCMFQFHVTTILNNSIDPIRLEEDIEHCVEWHFKLMNEKKKLCEELGESAWTCYHSKTESLRVKYKKMVERYLFN